MSCTTQTAVRSLSTAKRLKKDKHLHKTTSLKKAKSFQKDTSITSLDQPTQHAFILLHSLLPIVAHQLILNTLSTYASHYHVHPHILRVAVMLGYVFSFRFFLRREGRAIRIIGKKLGYLDAEHHPRDKAPRDSARLSWSLPLTIGSRTIMCVLVAYDPNRQPMDYITNPAWWAKLFVFISLYAVILDFYYYCMHRAWHEVPCLWRFHRTHHTIKHPNILFTAYADLEQEAFDIVGTPLLTFYTLKALGMPMDFYTWWICVQYIAFTEVMGHSGLRVYTTPPITCSWLLQLFGAELVIEDHDLHHRKGYRQARNYGKQTRIWDRLFNTCAERIETNPVDIQKGGTMTLPFY